MRCASASLAPRAPGTPRHHRPRHRLPSAAPRAPALRHDAAGWWPRRRADVATASTANRDGARCDGQRESGTVKAQAELGMLRARTAAADATDESERAEVVSARAAATRDGARAREAEARATALEGEVAAALEAGQLRWDERGATSS